VTLALSLAAAIALAVLLGAWRSHRELVRWLGRDPAGTRRLLRALALASAGALLAAAWLHAAQQPPRFSGADVDLVIALDTSASMTVRDTAPSRLQRALRLAGQLVESARGARLGLVLFAGDAYVALPLTLDHEVHRIYLQSIDSEVLSSKGSDVARALRVAAGVFDPRSPRPRRLVLLSDGEHSGGNLDDALVELRGAGIGVLAVGFGRVEGDVVPAAHGGPLYDQRGGVVVSRRSDALLERIAASSGGRYLREFEDAPSGADLLPPAREWLRSERTPGQERLFAVVLLVFALLAADLIASIAPRSGARWPRWLRAPSAALLGLFLLGLGPSTWLREGDEQLAGGKAQQALSLYRRNARAYGPSVPGRIRIGNALYQLDQHDRAAASYLEALREVTLGEHDARFVASFNLGVALLAQQRFAEARDHFWTALLERPASLEAKFNYEWATERMRELEPPATPELPPPPSNAGEGDGPSDDDGGAGDGGDGPGSQAVAGNRQRGAPELSEAEARRWLETIEDEVAEPLRRQAAQSLGSTGRTRGQGQVW
jgi:tetratricopeptide (TPR) repeat protein